MKNYFIKYDRNTSPKRKRMSKKCSSLQLGPLSEIRNSYVVGNFDLGMYSSVNRCQLEIGGGIGVSSYVSDTDFGNYAIVGSRVSIGGFEHPLDWLSAHPFQWNQGTEHWAKSVHFEKNIEQKPIPERTIIEPDTWVGNNSVVLSGRKIQTGSVVGAGSVVTKDTPPYSISVGNPAKIIGYRFDEKTILKLLELKWWELSFNLIASINFNNINLAIQQLDKIRSEI